MYETPRQNELLENTTFHLKDLHPEYYPTQQQMHTQRTNTWPNPSFTSNNLFICKYVTYIAHICKNKAFKQPLFNYLQTIPYWNKPPNYTILLFRANPRQYFWLSHWCPAHQVRHHPLKLNIKGLEIAYCSRTLVFPAQPEPHLVAYNCLNLPSERLWQLQALQIPSMHMVQTCRQHTHTYKMKL